MIAKKRLKGKNYADEINLGVGISHYTNGMSYPVKGGDPCKGNTALVVAGFLNLGDSARLKLRIAGSSDLMDSWSIDYTTFHAGLRFGF